MNLTVQVEVDHATLRVLIRSELALGDMRYRQTLSVPQLHVSHPASLADLIGQEIYKLLKSTA